ncbi:MAG: hypothetical protein M3R15_34815, partial [Acidobacteriota bacterium]|nr:hypothetical protein [Acidobacteriota bacterium]
LKEYIGQTHPPLAAFCSAYARLNNQNFKRDSVFWIFHPEFINLRLGRPRYFHGRCCINIICSVEDLIFEQLFGHI